MTADLQPVEVSDSEFEDDGAEASSFPGIWALIAIDCMSFAMFFAVFMSERLDKPELFDASARQLNIRLGLVNTLILISSSWLVALAVAAARRGDVPGLRRGLTAAIAVGSGFGVIKIFEYVSKISHGTTPLTNDFFMYYFALTGVHFLHYAIGLAALVFLRRKVAALTAMDTRLLAWIESGGLFWHMVDLLWVFLFPMLYLLGGGH